MMSFGTVLDALFGEFHAGLFEAGPVGGDLADGARVAGESSHGSFRRKI